MGYGVIWRGNDDEDMRIELPNDIDHIVYALAEIGRAVEESHKSEEKKEAAV